MHISASIHGILTVMLAVLLWLAPKKKDLGGFHFKEDLGFVLSNGSLSRIGFTNSSSNSSSNAFDDKFVKPIRGW